MTRQMALVGRGARWVGVTVVVLALAVVALVPAAAPAGAVGERAGAAVVVDPTGAVLEEGGSATAFGLRLPEGAACPGDSADDNYRVEAFLVRDGADPGAVVYGEMAPLGEGNSGLWDTNTNSFDGALTSDAPDGGEGLIVNLPSFSFGVLYPDELAAGEYRIGIACSLFNETTRYWDTSFVVIADPADQPAQFRWTAAPPDGASAITGSSGSASSSSSSTVVLLGVLVLLLLVVGLLYLWLRSRTPRPSPPKERQS